MIGERLKKLRVNAKLTQKDVADIINVTPQTISKWELDLSEPSIDLIKELAALYGVKVDELLDPHKTLSYENQSNIKTKEISLYFMYILLLGLGIAIPFVTYLSADIFALDYGLLNTFLPEGRDVIPIELTLSNILMLSIVIGFPVILFTLQLIDRKFLGHSVITFIALIINLSYVLPMIASPLFIHPNIGMIFHMVYIFILIAILLITISIQKWHIYLHIQNHPKTWIGFVGMILITIVFPFSFNVFYHYYFSQKELVLFMMMLLLAGLLMFKDVKKIQIPILALSFIILFGIIYSTVVYIFNSGLIVGSIVLYGYLLFLGLSLSEIKGDKLPLKEIFKLRLLPFELIILAIYIYLFLTAGDLFTYYKDQHTPSIFIHLSNLPKDTLFYLSLMVLILGMTFRWMKVKYVYVILYSVWLGFQVYYSILLLSSFHGAYWKMTDGLFLYIPVILGCLFILLFLSQTLYQTLFKKQKKLN